MNWIIFLTLSGLLVRVFLGDGRERVVKMKDPKPTAGQVVKAIADKEGLSIKASKLFGLFMVGKDLGRWPELCLCRTTRWHALACVFRSPHSTQNSPLQLHSKVPKMANQIHAHRGTRLFSLSFQTECATWRGRRILLCRRGGPTVTFRRGRSSILIANRPLMSASIKAKQLVLTGHYICTKEEMCLLTALHLQSLYGDFDPAKHSNGFITYVPTHAST